MDTRRYQLSSLATERRNGLRNVVFPLVYSGKYGLVSFFLEAGFYSAVPSFD